MHGQQNIKKKE